jgi:hypothetical protein
VEWELPEPIGMGRWPIPVDPKRKRFLLSLKNPCNFPKRKLLKAGEKNETIGSVGTKDGLTDNQFRRVRFRCERRGRMRSGPVDVVVSLLGEIPTVDAP